MKSRCTARALCQLVEPYLHTDAVVWFIFDIICFVGSEWMFRMGTAAVKRHGGKRFLHCYYRISTVCQQDWCLNYRKLNSIKKSLFAADFTQSACFIQRGIQLICYNLQCLQLQTSTCHQQVLAKNYISMYCCAFMQGNVPVHIFSWSLALQPPGRQRGSLGMALHHSPSPLSCLQYKHICLSRISGSSELCNGKRYPPRSQIEVWIAE